MPQKRCDMHHYSMGVSTNNWAIDAGLYLIPKVASAFSAIFRTSCNSSELSVSLAAPRFSVKYYAINSFRTEPTELHGY